MTFDLINVVGEQKILQAIKECKKICMVDNVKVRTHGHHFLPDSQDGAGDWSNAIYLSMTNHGRIHDGEFNGKILPCVETWVLRYLGIEFETELKEIDCVNLGGMGAGTRMHLYVEVPTQKYHTPFKCLDERKKNKPESNVMPWSAKNKLARKVRIE